jgi:hypothetical protein
MRLANDAEGPVETSRHPYAYDCPARRAGSAPRPQPGVCASGRGGAKRRRLDLIRLNSAVIRPAGGPQACPPSGDARHSSVS